MSFLQEKFSGRDETESLLSPRGGSSDFTGPGGKVAPKNPVSIFYRGLKRFDVLLNRFLENGSIHKPLKPSESTDVSRSESRPISFSLFLYEVFRWVISMFQSLLAFRPCCCGRKLKPESKSLRKRSNVQNLQNQSLLKIITIIHLFFTVGALTGALLFLGSTESALEEVWLHWRLYYSGLHHWVRDEDSYEAAVAALNCVCDCTEIERGETRRSGSFLADAPSISRYESSISPHESPSRSDPSSSFLEGDSWVELSADNKAKPPDKGGLFGGGGNLKKFFGEGVKTKLFGGAESGPGVCGELGSRCARPCEPRSARDKRVAGEREGEAKAAAASAAALKKEMEAKKKEIEERQKNYPDDPKTDEEEKDVGELRERLRKAWGETHGKEEGGEEYNEQDERAAVTQYLQKSRALVVAEAEKGAKEAGEAEQAAGKSKFQPVKNMLRPQSVGFRWAQEYDIRSVAFQREMVGWMRVYAPGVSSTGGYYGAR